MLEHLADRRAFAIQQGFSRRRDRDGVGQLAYLHLEFDAGALAHLDTNVANDVRLKARVRSFELVRAGLQLREQRRSFTVGDGLDSNIGLGLSEYQFGSSDTGARGIGDFDNEVAGDGLRQRQRWKNRAEQHDERVSMF